jgi:MoCo/4Fe-4S cofactor protein with predicted Tat translocation signal
MELKNQAVWTGVEDLTKNESFIALASQEFTDLPQTLSQENTGFAATRRDFLKYLGFSVGAATVAASCEIPVKRAIPYVTKPDSIVPGIANYYASSFVNGGDYAAILVKTREGRPIKIEGNDLSKVNGGGTSARVQASVLSLYDTARIAEPSTIKAAKDKVELAKTTWAELDKVVAGKLTPASQIRILTHTILSPMTNKAIAEFTKKFPNTKVVTYDPVSSAAILAANEQSFGDRAIPSYKFDAAEVIVSIGADFLGTWVSPIEYAAQYAKNRKIASAAEAKMSRHIQVESYMSLTGSNADNRVLIKPSEQGAAIAALYNEVATLAGGVAVTAPALNAKAAKALKKVAAELVAAKGKSLIVSGSNNVGEQVLVNATNNLLGNYGATIDFTEASLQRQGDEANAQALLAEMGGVNAVLVMGANPVFELPNGDKFAEALKKVDLTISFNPMIDETTAACKFAAPANHGLESWGDAQPKRGHYSLIQPTIQPLFNTRQSEQSLLTWAGVVPAAEQPMYDYLRATWQADMFSKQKNYATFNAFWDATLHNGVFQVAQNAVKPTFKGDTNGAAAAVTQPVKADVEITFYETVNIGGGQYANNPWLQEMPDPVTRTVWGNVLSVPVKWDGINDFNGFKDLKDGDKVEIEVAGKKLKCTVVRQFGQPEGTVAIAVGYGRTQGGYCGTGVGTNVQGVLPMKDGRVQYFSTAKVSGKTGTDASFASVQYHHTLGITGMGKEEKAIINVDEKALGYKGFQGSLTARTVIRRTNLKDVKEFAVKLKEERKNHQKLNSYTLYRGHMDKYTSGHHWGMNIDLNACTGCGACTVACMAENNVPVVGKDEVARHHEMAWLRIDRYYYGDVENPNVVYQPMMCQHCDNAPCENVCPVNATSHSSEGLNQMTYNRCIGTRYCANNCPYKVRRFNWQDYTTADIFPWNERDLRGKTLGFRTEMPYGADNLTRMVLNPDVTVRTRGVIEKCSLCVQRIQEGKLTAKKESRQLRDNDVKTACQTACPTGAIVFGDKNNPESQVSKLNKADMNFIVLEEINVKSNMTYSVKVTNRDEKLEA